MTGRKLTNFESFGVFSYFQIFKNTYSDILYSNKNQLFIKITCDNSIHPRNFVPISILICLLFRID